MMRDIQAMIAVALLASCSASTEGTSVKSIMANPQAHDSTRVEVRGVLRSTHGLFNLFSERRDECIGLLIYERDRPQFTALEGQHAIVSGRLEAEGCGRHGICDEHLCSPTILTDISVRRP